MYSREADRHPQRGTGQTTPSPAVPPLKASETRDLCTSPHDGRALLNSARACRRRRVLVDRTSCGCEARAATARITRTRVGSLAVWDAPLAGAPTSGGRTATLTGVGCVGNTGTLHASHGGRNYQGELLGRALLACGDPHLLESCCRPRCHAPCISAECCLAGVPPAPCLRAVREMRPACAERDPQRGARRTAG